MTYQIFILLYRFAFNCFQLFSKKNHQRYVGLQNTVLHNKDQYRLWIHCASAGEYEQTIPFIQSVRKKLNIEICISFFSASGMNYYQLNPLADFVFYLPFDTRKNAERLINELRPDYVIWVKYEFWQNILHQIYRHNIPCDLLFADLKHIEQKIWLEKNRIQKLLPQFSNVYSTSASTELPVHYKLIHDGKWMQSLKNIEAEFQDKTILEFVYNSSTIIVGSAHMSDLQVLSKYISKHPDKNFKWLIVPHETDGQTLQKIQNLFPDSSLYSKNKSEHSILIVDKTGILKYLYRFAQIAWIGGGFDKSIHNALEAAAYQIPLISGDHLSGMSEAEILKAHNVLKTFRNEEELHRVLEEILQTETQHYKKIYEALYTKNAVDNYSTSIIQDIEYRLSSGNQSL